MGLVAWQANAALTIVVAGDTVAARLIRVSSAIGVALVVLAASARALRISEFTEAMATVRQRIFGSEERVMDSCYDRAFGRTGDKATGRPRSPAD